MRIISGKFKGRRFYPPADAWPTRPTTDFSKEALFSILNNHFDFEEMRALDLFGGTGNHCYELVSRGCLDATYVDKHGPAIKFVRKTLAELGAEGAVRIFQMDVFKFIESATGRWDFIFAGPPYGMPALDSLPDRILGKNILADEGWFCLEHNPNHHFADHPNCFDVRKYGKTIFSFFSNEPEETP